MTLAIIATIVACFVTMKIINGNWQSSDPLTVLAGVWFIAIAIWIGKLVG